MSATVHVALTTVLSRSSVGAAGLTLHPQPRIEGMVTSGLTAQIVTDGASPATELEALGGDVWVVTADGGPVRVAIGPAPEAGADAGYYIPSGQTRDFAGITGHKCSVING